MVVKFHENILTRPAVIGFWDDPKDCPRYVVFESWVQDPDNPNPDIVYPSRYVVWDVMNKELADLTLWGGPTEAVDYPCLIEDIQEFIDSVTDEEKTYLYDRMTAQDTSCDESEDETLSTNIGCGDLYNVVKGQFDGNLETQVVIQCGGVQSDVVPYHIWELAESRCNIKAWKSSHYDSPKLRLGDSYNFSVTERLGEYKIEFINGGPYEIKEGHVIVGMLSGATAIVVSVSSSGLWANEEASGTLVLKRHIGDFIEEDIKVAGWYSLSSSSSSSFSSSSSSKSSSSSSSKSSSSSYSSSSSSSYSSSSSSVSSSSSSSSLSSSSSISSSSSSISSSSLSSSSSRSS